MMIAWETNYAKYVQNLRRGQQFESRHSEGREGSGKRKLVTPGDAEIPSNLQHLSLRTQTASVNNISGLYVRAMLEVISDMPCVNNLSTV
jgi:hypothetical protein